MAQRSPCTCEKALHRIALRFKLLDLWLRGVYAHAKKALKNLCKKTNNAYLVSFTQHKVYLNSSHVLSVLLQDGS